MFRVRKHLEEKKQANLSPEIGRLRRQFRRRVKLRSSDTTVHSYNGKLDNPLFLFRHPL
jgi:hypothetical protein